MWGDGVFEYDYSSMGFWIVFILSLVITSFLNFNDEKYLLLKATAFVCLLIMASYASYTCNLKGVSFLLGSHFNE